MLVDLWFPYFRLSDLRIRSLIKFFLNLKVEMCQNFMCRWALSFLHIFFLCDSYIWKSYISILTYKVMVCYFSTSLILKMIIKDSIFISPLFVWCSHFKLSWQGFSTGLPERVQLPLLRTLPGLENCSMLRPAYAVEYDYLPAHQCSRSLMTKKIDGLFFSGQINGTTGYEEAAAQVTTIVFL